MIENALKNKLLALFILFFFLALKEQNKIQWYKLYLTRDILITIDTSKKSDEVTNWKRKTKKNENWEMMECLFALHRIDT